MYAVQQFKFGNMRSLITLLFSLVSILGMAQNEGLNNNNSNVNTTNSIEPGQFQVATDTTSTILEEDEQEELKNETR